MWEMCLVEMTLPKIALGVQGRAGLANRRGGRARKGLFSARSFPQGTIPTSSSS